MKGQGSCFVIITVPLSELLSSLQRIKRMEGSTEHTYSLHGQFGRLFGDHKFVEI